MDHGEHRHGRYYCVSLSFKILELGLTASSAITAYALEKYPGQSTCVSAILNMWRTCGGFAVGYFQPAWIARNGIGPVFGVQAAVLCAAIVMTITPVLLMKRTKLQVIEDRELDDVSER